MVMVMVMVMNFYGAFSIIIFKCTLQARDLWVRSEYGVKCADVWHKEV